MRRTEFSRIPCLCNQTARLWTNTAGIVVDVSASVLNILVAPANQRRRRRLKTSVQSAIVFSVYVMSHSQMLGKVESGGGPIFKVVLEC